MGRADDIDKAIRDCWGNNAVLAAAHIIDEVIEPSVAALAVALTKSNQEVTALKAELAAARKVIEPFVKCACGEILNPAPQDWTAARDWHERHFEKGTW